MTSSRGGRLTDLIDAHAGKLVGYFLNRVEDLDVVPDLVNETLYVASRRILDVPRSPDRAGMWLFGVARRVLANHRRGVRRKAALDDRLRREFDQTVAAEPLSDVAIEVRLAVDSLQPKQAELIRLVHWDGFSVREAATLLRIPVSTAHDRHEAARRALRSRLVHLVGERSSER